MVSRLKVFLGVCVKHISTAVTSGCAAADSSQKTSKYSIPSQKSGLLIIVLTRGYIVARAYNTD